MANETTIISKMSVKTVKANPKVASAAPEGTSSKFKLCQIYGQANGTKIVEDRNSGDSHESITGNFEAKNLQDGTMYSSGVLYLPKGIHEQILSAVKGLTNDTDSISFALEISAVKATNPIGYSYEAISLMKPVGVDPLEAIRAALPQHDVPAKELPAPASKGKK